MARAMVTDSKVLLMDEPLSNLDARLREQMRVELRKITKSIGVTTLYVTHDQAEALSLGDKVCVMNLGEILQIAAPQRNLRQAGESFRRAICRRDEFRQGRGGRAGKDRIAAGRDRRARAERRDSPARR